MSFAVSTIYLWRIHVGSEMDYQPLPNMLVVFSQKQQININFRIFSGILCTTGCKLLVYPGAFNMTTGPAHWELLQRGR